ncbi:hypothetical protein [Sinorhizobium meliloti]|nr:hypothetical protein [Sinorhizobium meliloti]
MNHKELTKHYAEWIDNLILEYADRHRVSWQPIDSYIQCNGHFITFSYDRYAISRRKSASNECSTTRLSPEFFNVDCVYKRVCRSLLGRKYFKKRDLQPLMIAAADVNGTRFNPRPESMDNVHIHSFWLLPTGQEHALQVELERAKLDPDMDFRDIHSERATGLTQTSNEPSRLASYMTKFVGANAIDMRLADDLLIYPFRVVEGPGDNP